MKKTILITGASSGFGREAAKLFQQNDWNVIATMRSPENETELSGLADVLVTRLDVEDQDSIKAAVDQGLHQFGRIDALINNAGYGLIGVFESSTRQQFQKQFDVNFFGLMDVTRTVLPFMRQQGNGVIINVTSFGGQIGLPFGTPYNSSKFAVEGFSEALAHELHPMNITVKIVEPGSVSTSFRSSMQIIKNEIPAYNDFLASFPGRVGAVAAHITKATPEEVAQTIYEAVTDGTERFRYIIGDDAAFYIETKRKNSDEEFMRIIRNFLVN